MENLLRGFNFHSFPEGLSTKSFWDSSNWFSKNTFQTSDGFGFFVDPASHYHGAAGVKNKSAKTSGKVYFLRTNVHPIRTELRPQVRFLLKDLQIGVEKGSRGPSPPYKQGEIYKCTACIVVQLVKNFLDCMDWPVIPNGMESNENKYGVNIPSICNASDSNFIVRKCYSDNKFSAKCVRTALTALTLLSSKSGFLFLFLLPLPLPIPLNAIKSV